MREILVVWESGRTSDRLLGKANLLAKHTGAKVRIVLFVHAADNRKKKDEKATSLNDKLENGIDAQFDAGVEVSTQLVDCQDMVDWVCQATKEHPIDLVIKSRHQSGGQEYSPQDWKLIRQLTCPLLILCPTRSKKSHACIMATLDIKSTSALQKQINHQVLATASEWAQCHGYPLHVTYVLPIAKALEELVIVEPSDVLHKKGAAAAKKMQQLIREEGVAVAGSHISAGNPSVEIASVASKVKASLVVMGSVGRKGLKGLLLGNTAEKIICNLHTDLLVVKPAND